VKNDHRSSRQEELLEKAIAEYREAWADGERLDPGAFCREHPECGVELRGRLDRFLFVAEGLRRDTAPSSAERPIQPMGESLLGKELGDFEIIREIGRGGMGVVFEAEQASLGRRVAMKVLPAHLTLRAESVERFKREASTASRLRHPGIVEIYSVGSVEDTHFFTLELVDGTPLDQILAELRDEGTPPASGERLLAAATSPGSRPAADSADGGDSRSGWMEPGRKRSYIETVCRLVSQVADALDYAHAAGVIHRDVKPSNILVRPDGSAILTDFGLAREEGLASLTVTGEFAGTPHYTSPERAQPRWKEVDHRTDIYSLGVTLYELLTLRRPFDGKTSQEILGKIVSADPKPPRALNSLIPRDLQTICQVAMEKNPDRRYQTARELADDIERFLKYEPVQARPVGVVTRTMRLIRRNPAYTALVFVAICGPLAFGFQQKLANIEIAEALEHAEEETKKARESEEDLILAFDMLSKIFETVDRIKERPHSFTLKDFLRQVEEDMNKYLPGRPKALARTMEFTAKGYELLGLYSDAEPLFAQAHKIDREVYGEKQERSITSAINLAHANKHNGRYSEAERIFEKYIGIGRPILGLENEVILNAMSELAILYLQQGWVDEASALLAEVLEVCEKIHGPDRPNTLEVIGRMSRIRFHEKKPRVARELARKAYDGLKSEFGETHPRTLAAERHLLLLYSMGNRYKELDGLYLESYQRHRDELGPEHPDALQATQLYGYFLFDTEGPDEAEPHYTKALKGYRKQLGDGHPRTVNALMVMATLRDQQGRIEKAEELYHQALKNQVDARGWNYGSAWGIMNRLIKYYYNNGREDEGERILLKLLEVLPQDHGMIINLKRYFQKKGWRMPSSENRESEVDAQLDGAEEIDS